MHLINSLNLEKIVLAKFDKQSFKSIADRSAFFSKIEVAKIVVPLRTSVFLFILNV